MKPKIRLVHYADYGGAYGGSFISMLKEVGEEAHRRGWEFNLVFSPVAAEREWLEDLSEFAVSILPKGVLLPMESDHERRINHTHFSSYDIAAARESTLNQGAVHTFWHAHSNPPASIVRWARNVVRFTLLARGVTKILCVSPQIQHAVKCRLGWKAHLFPNAIDVDRYPPILDPNGADGKPPTILHLGYNWEVKGGDIALAAISALPDFRLVVLGAPPKARKQAEELGVSSQVDFLPPLPNLRPVFEGVDVLAGTSRAEGVPYAVLEALSSGLPVALTPIPGHKFIKARVKVGVTMASSMDAKAVRDAIVSAYESRQSIDPKEIHDSVTQDFGMDAWVERLFSEYESALIA